MTAFVTTEAFRERIAPLGLGLDDSTIQRLLAYLTLLQKWNTVYNLTAIRDAGQMLVQHLFDCLSILPTLDRLAPTRLLDVGSGGGLPGIVIAIVRPAWQITLNDLVGKKTAFLLQVKAELSLANVDVINARVETLDAPPGGYDVITSRAFAALADFHRLSHHLLAPGGHLVAMKGVRSDAELSTLVAAGLRVDVVPLSVPELNAQRHLVIASRLIASE